jgi:hypothetical protein
VQIGLALGQCLLLPPKRTCGEPAQRVRYVPIADILSKKMDGLASSNFGVPTLRAKNLIQGPSRDPQSGAVADSDGCPFPIDQTTGFKVLKRDRYPGAPYGKHGGELFVSKPYFL